jgi:hypothetical protein
MMSLESAQRPTYPTDDKLENNSAPFSDGGFSALTTVSLSQAT